MKKNTQIAIFLAISICFCTAFADVVITNESISPGNQIQGYIENTQVYFSVTSGESNDNGAQSRTMRRVDLDINGTKVVVQNSDDKELYVKGQDVYGHIVKFAKNDYATINHALENLAKTHENANTDKQLQETVGMALNLLVSWPPSMPLLIWQNAAQRISAVDSDTVISTSANAPTSAKKAKVRQNGITKIDQSILLNPDAILQLPEIEAVEILQLPEVEPSAIPHAPIKFPRAMGDSSSNSSRSLCSSMGSSVSGKYPLISVTNKYPFTKIDGYDSYSATVGGDTCLGRCGGGCTASVSVSGYGVYGFGQNSYSEDCLDHDMCVSRRGNVGYCNIIFSDAAGDFTSSPCGHDLQISSIILSNSSSASYQPTTISSKQDLYVIYTVKNGGSTKLPNKSVSFDIYVDGSKKTTTGLSEVLSAYGSKSYYYKLGSSNSYKAGGHYVSIEIKASNLIETSTTNNYLIKAFTLN